MRVSILTNRLEEGISKGCASARLRGDWVAKYLSKYGSDVSVDDVAQAKRADVVIFQKFYESLLCYEVLHGMRGKVCLDLCDADWLWSAQREFKLKKFLPAVDCVTCGSTQIALWVTSQSPLTPVSVIPDGIDLDLYPLPLRNHVDKTHLTFVWFGNRSNWALIEPHIQEVEGMGHIMITVSDHPKATYPWELDTVNGLLRRGDIFLNPRGQGLFNESKGNNKDVAAWALGLPSCRSVKEAVYLFGDSGARHAESVIRRKEVETLWSMEVLYLMWQKMLVQVCSRGKLGVLGSGV